MLTGHGTRARLVALLIVIVAGAAMLQGCRTGEQAPGTPAEAATASAPATKNEHMIPPPGHGPYTGTVADWPLWFPWHKFGAHCFSVQGCRISYARMPFGTGRPRPSFESLGRPLEDVLRAGNGPVRNFPPPAEVTWTALDGTPLAASVDIAEIFADRMVRHTVVREDIMENATIPYPGIILVVDDRTISVYMSTWIALKESLPKEQGKLAGQLHTGIVLVHTQSY